MNRTIVLLHKISAPPLAKFFSMSIMFYALTGCGYYFSPSESHSSLSLMDQQIIAAEKQCRKQLIDGQYKKESEMMEYCLTPAKISAFRAYHNDILSNKFEAMELYRIKLLQQVETGILSERIVAQRMRKFESGLDEKIAAHEREVDAAEAKRQQLADEKQTPEQAKISRYYKENRREDEELVAQRRQIEALKAQQLQMAREAEEQRRSAAYGAALQSLGNSLHKKYSPPPQINCSTVYNAVGSTTQCH